MTPYCFCTLAVGQRYRTHALVLARDLQRYAPNVPLVVLTDQPAAFDQLPQVRAFPHRLQSVKGYHDKRFVLAKALTLFDTCIFLDSDVRILGPVPQAMTWSPGITARTGCNILKHNSGKNQRQALHTVEQVAQTLDIDLSQARWFHEFMFTVKKQAGAEIEFLQFWQAIAYFFELQGLYDGEGNVMALAAALADLTVRVDTADRFPFFKDNIERVRIQRGQSNPDDTQPYFDLQNRVEYPKRSFLGKALQRLISRAATAYRWLRLRLVARQDAIFQRWFNQRALYGPETSSNRAEQAAIRSLYSVSGQRNR